MIRLLIYGQSSVLVSMRHKYPLILQKIWKNTNCNHLTFIRWEKCVAAYCSQEIVEGEDLIGSSRQSLWCQLCRKMETGVVIPWNNDATKLVSAWCTNEHKVIMGDICLGICIFFQGTSVLISRCRYWDLLRNNVVNLNSEQWALVSEIAWHWLGDCSMHYTSVELGALVFVRCIYSLTPSTVRSG